MVMDINSLIILDRLLSDLAHRAPIQIGTGEVDETLLAYYDELDGLTGQALEDEIERLVFIGAMTAAVGTFLLRLFLIGTDTGEIPGDGQSHYDEQLAINEEAIPGLANDIYSGRYGENEDTGQTADEGRSHLRARLVLWTASAAGVYALGQLFNPSVENYRWQIGGTIQHCADCARLNGQVHSKEAWLSAGIQPQSPDLLCGGWRCDCSFLPTTALESGGF